MTLLGETRLAVAWPGEPGCAQDISGEVGGGLVWSSTVRPGEAVQGFWSGQPAQGEPRRCWVYSGEVRMARRAGSAQADRPIPDGALRQASMVRLGKARLGTVWTGLVGYGQAGCGAARILAPAWSGRTRHGLAGSGVARPGKDAGAGQGLLAAARTVGADTRARPRQGRHGCAGSGLERPSGPARRVGALGDRIRPGVNASTEEETYDTDPCRSR